MLSIRRPRTALLIVAILASIFAVSPACTVDGGEFVRVENRTDGSLLVFENGNPAGLVAPHSTAKFGIPMFDGTLTYEVKPVDENRLGGTLATRTFTWHEIEQEGGIRILIE